MTAILFMLKDQVVNNIQHERELNVFLKLLSEELSEELALLPACAFVHCPGWWVSFTLSSVYIPDTVRTVDVSVAAHYLLLYAGGCYSSQWSVIGYRKPPPNRPLLQSITLPTNIHC